MEVGGVKSGSLQWYVRRGAVVRGPFASAKVRHYLLEGKLTLADEVSDDRSTWRSIDTVAEVVPPELRGGDLDVDRDALRRLERQRAIRTMLVATGVVVVLIAATMIAGEGQPEAVRNCAAPPAAANDYEGCVLSGVEWTGATLADARLANVTLADSGLSTADLRAADLRYADLSRSDLSYARMHGASLLGATLRNTDLTNADLGSADLSFADLSGARIGGARFDGAKFDGALWIDGSRCAVGNCPR